MVMMLVLILYGLEKCFEAAYLCLNKPGFVISYSACKITSCSPPGLLFPGVDQLAKVSTESLTRQNQCTDAKITWGLTKQFPAG